MNQAFILYTYFGVGFAILFLGLVYCGIIWEDLGSIDREDYPMIVFTAAIGWPFGVIAFIFWGIGQIPILIGKQLRKLIKK